MHDRVKRPFIITVVDDFDRDDYYHILYRGHVV